MNITVTDQENCKKQMRLEIPTEAVRAEIEKIASKYARQVSIPGFRRGHVPPSVVKSRFRKELRDEAASHLVPGAIEEALKEKEFKMASEPSIEEYKVTDDDAIQITFTFEVRPEFELTGHKGMRLTKRVYKVREEDMQRQIDRLREGLAEMAPVEDRGAQIGDTVTVNLSGRPVSGSKQTAEPVAEESSEEQETAPASEETAEESEKPESPADREFSQNDVEIELGGNGVLQEFTDALMDARPGETRQVTVTYPEDFSDEEYAGKSYDYSLEVTAVRIKELPEVDDDFAREVNEKYENLEALREDIRSSLEKAAEFRTTDELRTQIMDQLLDRNRFAVPESIVQKQMDMRFNTFIRRLASQGLDPRHLKLDWRDLRDSQRGDAERDVRGLFILASLAETENIEASEEEVEKEIEEIATAHGQDVSSLKARLTKEGGLDSIKEQVRNRKALDFVIASADIETEEFGLSEETEGAESGEDRRTGD